MSATLSRPRARSAAIPSLAALGVGVLAIVAIFWPESRAAVTVWQASTAYGHCFLVVPIVIYLIWDRRDSLRGIQPQPTPALALLGLPLPLVWLAAERLGIMEGRQLVAIATLELLFLTVLGWTLFRALIGPMLYLFFLVPFGAFLTPVLQSFTAVFIDLGLNVLAIPHFVSDMTIEISAGTFFVAEACAGLRFLIASIAFGVFFALLNYRSPGRRAAFIAASIIVPIIANGFRALGIVVLGNILGSAEAAAADHIIYGWVFFSAIMLLLVAAGLPFRELPAPAPPGRSTTLTSRPHPWPVLVVLAWAAIGPATAMALDSRITPAILSGQPALTAPPGCQLTPAPSDHPDRAIATLACDGRLWTITLQAVSARSTGAALAETRQNLIGPYDAEEATAGSLDTPPWTYVISRQPVQITATSTWLDGLPAPGGIAQRLLQARHSLLGAPSNPAVLALALRSNTPLFEAEIRAARADLERFAAAQPNLPAEITRVTSPPP